MSYEAAAAASAEKSRWFDLVSLIEDAKEAAERVSWGWESIENAAEQAKDATDALEYANRDAACATELVDGNPDPHLARKARDARAVVKRKITVVAKSHEMYLGYVETVKGFAAESKAASAKVHEASDDFPGKPAADNVDEADEAEKRPSKRARADKA